MPLLSLIGAGLGFLSSQEQRKAAEAQAKARQAELEMQIATVEAQQKQQEEMLKKIALYGGAGLVAVLILRGLMK